MKKFFLAFGAGLFLLSPAFFAAAALSAPVLQDPVSLCSGSNPYVTLNWSSVAGASSYEIYKDSDPAPLNSVAVTSYDDLAVSATEIHSYFIKARNGAESSPASNTKTITVGRCGPVLLPPSMSCTASGPKIDLSWNNLAGVTRYDVFRNTTLLGQVLPPQTSYSDTNAAGNASYAYKVTAVWPGETKDSNIQNITSPACPPTLTAAGDCSAPGAEVSLAWNTMPGATEYQVFKGGAFLASAGAGTSYADKAVIQKNSYTYFIRALYPTASADSNSAPATAPRCPPVLSAQNTCNPSNPTLPEIKLLWSSTADATSYDVYEALRGFLGPVSAPVTAFVDYLSSTDNGRTFAYRVDAKGVFSTLTSNEAAATADCSAAAIPSPDPVLSAGPVCSAGDSQMSLSWTPANNVLFYTIERTNNSTATVSTRNVLSTDTSFTDANLEIGTSYSYKVLAVGNGGAAASNTVTKTSVDCTPPSSPALAAPAPICTSGQPAVNLSWTQSTNTAKYQIYRGGALLTEINNAATVTYRDNAVLNSTLYSYEVRAVGPGGTTSSGAPKSVTTLNCASPSAPVLSVAAPVCAGSTVSIGLSWTPSANVSYYTVYRKRTGDTSFSAIVPSTTATSYNNTGLAQGLAEVSYFVTAFGQPGTNPATSNLVTRSTPYCPPSTPTLTVIPACSLGSPIMNLSWTAAINTTSYKIQRGGVEIGTVTPPTTAFSDNTGLVSGQPYTYTVSAVGPGGTKTSGSVSKTALTCTAPGKPVVSWSALCSASNPQIKLTWSPTVNTVSYDVYRGATKLTATPILFSSGAMSYSFTDTSALNANTSYSYTVAANGPAGVSPTFSDPVPAKTSFCQPSKPAPTVTTLCSLGKAVFRVSWTDATPSNTTSYEVRRNGALVAPSIVPPTLTYTDDNGGAGFTVGTVNTYVVTAVGPGGTGRTDSDPRLSPGAANCASPDQPVISGLGLACTGGGALSFDGIDDYVNLGNPVDLKITGDQTIEIWLKPTDFAARRNPYAKAYGGEGTITIETTGNVTYFYGNCGGDCGTSGVSYDSLVMTSPLVANTWTHLAVVRDISGGTIRWYKNGVQTNSKTATISPARISSLNAYIGQGYAGKFKGLIDEVRVYNRALLPAEIAAHYDGGRGSFGAPESGLKGGWHLDEGDGTTAADYSGRGNNGTLLNGPTWVENQVAYQGVGPSSFQQVRVDWSSASNASYYDVYRGATKIAKVTALNPQPASYTYYDISYYSSTNVLTAGSSYAYKVIAVNSSSGVSSPSPVVTSAAMPLCSPTKPTWTATYPYASCSADKSVANLGWTYAAPAGHTSNLQISRDDGLGLALIKTLAAPAFSFIDDNNGAGLQSNKSYSYRITGAGPTGLKNDSLVKSALTPVCAIPTPVLKSECTFSAFNPVTHLLWDRTISNDPLFYIGRKKASEAVFNVSYQWIYNYNASSPTNIREWLILGPFSNNPDPSGYNTDYIDADPNTTVSETSVKPRALELVNGKSWFRYIVPQATDFVNLDAVINPLSADANVVAYAFAYVVNNTGGAATGELRLGSDDGIKAYFNGVKIHDNHIHRAAVRDQDKPPAFSGLRVTLNPGVNTILLKIDQGGGGWGFYARLTDSSGNPLLPTISTTDSAAPNNEAVEYYLRSSPSQATSPIVAAPAFSCSPGKPAPAITPACDAQESIVTLNWAAAANTLKYNIWRGDTPGSIAPIPPPAGVTTATTFTDRNIEENKLYYYKVEAVGNGTMISNAVSGTSLSCAIVPDKPVLTSSNVTPTCAGMSSRVLLDWPDAANALSYTVVRNGIDIAAVTESVFTDGSVTGGVSYTYKIRAAGSGGSSTSDPVTVGAIDCSGPPPPPILNSAAVIPRTTNVLLTWSDNSLNEEGFRVDRTVAVGALEAKSLFAGVFKSFDVFASVISPDLAINTTTYTDTTAQENTTYDYRVGSFNGASVSPSFSGTLRIFVPIPPPSNFSVATTCDPSGRNITFDWAPGAGTTPGGGTVKYNAYWSRTDAGPYALLPSPCSVDITSTSCTADVPVFGAKLFYKIIAQNNGGTTEVPVIKRCAPVQPKYREILPPF